MLLIRSAAIDDIQAITEIYNEAILNTVATFDTVSKTIEEQKTWFLSHDEHHPVIIAELDKKIIGWASLSRWSGRCAYDSTAEISFYVHHQCRGRGFGKTLLEAITKEAKKIGMHTVLARITAGNDVSVYLHKAQGYEHIGTLKEVGKKFGKLLDVHLMQKIL